MFVGKKRKSPEDWWSAGTVGEDTGIKNNLLIYNRADEMLSKQDYRAGQVSVSILMHQSIPSPLRLGIEMSGSPVIYYTKF